jgi:radical SAM protein with 4Fe4S-binding SPASM domain
MSFNRYALKLARHWPAVLLHFTPRLRAVAIEPTSACNLKCEMCYSQNPQLFDLRKAGIMAWEHYVKIVDELVAIGTVDAIGVNFGGESLLHKRFADMLQYAAGKKKFSIGFNTNGALLTETLAQVMVDSMDNVVFSLDGLREQHEKIRRGSNWDKVESNIRTLVAVRGAKKKPSIAVNLSWSTQSAADVQAFVEYWHDKVDRAEVYPMLSECIQMDTRSEFFRGVKLEKQKRCTWGDSYMAILWNGDVTTCCHDINGMNRELKLGNVVQQGVAGVWGGEAYSRFRYESYSNAFPKGSLCAGCTTWRHRLKPKVEVTGGMRVEHTGLSKRYSKA